MYSPVPVIGSSFNLTVLPRACELGTIPTDPGDQCICDIGLSWDSITRRCVHCPASTYKEIKGNMACSACPLHRYFEIQVQISN